MNTAPWKRPAFVLSSEWVASVRFRFWSSSTALAILGAHAMRGCCVSTAVGTRRTELTDATAVIGEFGRHAHPVVRPGFKPGGRRQPFPGRFDSCYLPPDRCVINS